MRWQNRTLFGQILLDQGLLTQTQLTQALEEQRRTKELLGNVLIRLKLINDEQTILSVLSKQLNVDLVALNQIQVEQQALDKLPARVAKYYKVFPVRYSQGVLTVAVNNPLDVKVLDDLSLMTQSSIETVLATQKEILESIRNHYGVGAETIEQMMGEQSLQTLEQDVQVIEEESSDASISRFLNQILLQAHKDHATDVHVEPFEDSLRIRYRIDGVLYDAKIPESLRFFQDTLISRIKVISNLDIAEKRLPQDGRFKVKISDSELDLRVSFLPTPYGEAASIRILNSIRLYNFQELGFSDRDRANLALLLNKPHGIVIVTGPTGSGKTTTLYACLASLNTEDTKIITIEDPIEYQLKGVVQVQTHAEIGLTFASIFRSVLRCDPDIIMVGEIRDTETAQIAIKTALTGHLVFSTLHTNDAASGVTRLLDMGVEPYLIASSIECFIAQRLVRAVCPQCRLPVTISPEIIKEFNLKEYDPKQTLYESKGCKQCRMTGFVGRQVICEILFLNDEIRTMITQRATAGEIRTKAIQTAGMRTLRQHGWEKIVDGTTTPSEVLQVTQE